MQDLIKVIDRVIKVRKEIIYQENCKLWYLEQDAAIGWNSCKICFIQNLNIILETLHSNNLRTIDTKFEILEGVDISDIIIRKMKKYWLKDYLLTVQVNNVNLFLATKEGGSKHSSNIIVIVSAKTKIVAIK